MYKLLGIPDNPTSRYVMTPSLEAVVQSIQGWIAESTVPGRVVVTVSGRSGSGKSTLSRLLAAALDKAGVSTFIFHQDHYIRPEKQADPQWTIGHMDLERMGQDVQQCIKEISLTKPVFDQQTREFSTETCDLTGIKVILVEGLYSHKLPTPYKLFIASDPKAVTLQRWERNLARPAERRQTKETFETQTAALDQDAKAEIDTGQKDATITIDIRPK